VVLGLAPVWIFLACTVFNEWFYLLSSQFKTRHRRSCQKVLLSFFSLCTLHLLRNYMYICNYVHICIHCLETSFDFKLSLQFLRQPKNSVAKLFAGILWHPRKMLINPKLTKFGCRIARFFFITIYQCGEEYAKLEPNMPNDYKIYPRAIK
jgi:hypothetical protein